MSTTIRPGWAHTSDGLGVEGEFHGHRWTLRVTQSGLPPGRSPREALGATTGIWVSRDGGPWHASPAKDVLATMRGIETDPGMGRQVRFGAPPFDAVATLADGSHLDLWYDELSGDASEVTVVPREGLMRGVMVPVYLGVTSSREDHRDKTYSALRRRGYDVVSLDSVP